MQTFSTSQWYTKELQKPANEFTLAKLGNIFIFSTPNCFLANAR